MKRFLLAIILLSSICHAQSPPWRDTVILEYTPKVRELGGVEVLAKKPTTTMIVNAFYTSGGCWSKLSLGDTLFGLGQAKDNETLIDLVRRVVPGIERGGMTNPPPNRAPGEDVPTYKGREMAVYLNEQGIGMKTWQEIMAFDKKRTGMLVIKFVQNFACSVGSWPALCIYTKMLGRGE